MADGGVNRLLCPAARNSCQPCRLRLRGAVRAECQRLGEPCNVRDHMTILGSAGSLRTDSYNRAALRAAQALAPAGVTLESFDFQGIPPFNQDDEPPPPGPVATRKTRMRAADAILVVRPEYNYSIPGVLKHAIDWASRPYGGNAWDGKPVAVMGASVGTLGTARAPDHLRHVFVVLHMHALNRPEVMISNAAQRFNAQGRLTDTMTQDLIRQLLRNLVDWTRQLREPVVKT